MTLRKLQNTFVGTEIAIAKRKTNRPQNVQNTFQKIFAMNGVGGFPGGKRGPVSASHAELAQLRARLAQEMVLREVGWRVAFQMQKKAVLVCFWMFIYFANKKPLGRICFRCYLWFGVFEASKLTSKRLRLLRLVIAESWVRKKKVLRSQNVVCGVFDSLNPKINRCFLLIFVSVHVSAVAR